ncbi:MAG TPA: EFR1 family ferrodoxin [Bacteroidales bacterium]|nr:EFR1 family ferrodoxin [Bacteroidales bacterium]
MNRWDSLYIYYISGTGNARLSSHWIAAVAEDKGIKTVVQQIDRLENITFPLPGTNPLIGFAFPTHGFNAAPIMLRFLAGFPPGLGKEIFLLNTRAGMKLSKLFVPGLTGLALVIPALILFLKGYKCIGFRPVDMPSNWIPLHPGLKTSVVESIIKRCETIVRDFAEKIFSGRKVWRGLYSLPVDLLISPVSAGYYFGGRFFLAKTFMASSKCNNCGLCIKECPTSSIIYLQERPYWKLTCESCMRCLNHCPQKAIEATHGLATGMIFLISAINAGLIFWLINSLGIRPEALWWKILSMVIEIAVMVGTAAMVYLITHYAMRIKPIRALIRFTSLTALPGWRRYRYLKGERRKTSIKGSALRPEP